MFKRILGKIEQRRFSASVVKVFQTAPIKRRAAPLTFVSQLCKRDVAPYLVAIKSIYKAFGEGDIVLVNDGSLDSQDIGMLERHLGDLEIIDIASVDVGACPKGGTWERLTTLIERSQSGYAIQVDADLVALGPMNQAVKAYRDGVPFAIGNLQRPGRVTFSEMSAWLKETSFGEMGHIQVTGERHLADMPNADERYYVRTSSAFTGFPKAAVNFGHMEAFSQQMEGLLGQRWTEWGTEQFTSNAMVAAAGETVELVPPMYVNNMPHLEVSQADLIHFFGTYRYTSSRYRRAVEKALSSLS